MKATSFKHHNY